MKERLKTKAPEVDDTVQDIVKSPEVEDTVREDTVREDTVQEVTATLQDKATVRHIECGHTMPTIKLSKKTV